MHNPVTTLARRAAARLQSQGATPADAGMTTAEYAVGTVGACGVGGLIYELAKDESVRSLVIDTVKKAISYFSQVLG